MATLLMRTPELADAEKLAIANVERAWQHNETALRHGGQEGRRKASSEVRSRARKGKPGGQKKQPQRGLGVAQLEKLRMQEQSKQEAACLASLQSLPSMGFTDHQNQNGAMYLRHIKGAIAHHHANGSARHGSGLAFGNGRLDPPDKLAEYLARDGHRHVGKGTMDGDVFRTFMSLAATDHSGSVSLSRHERGHSVSIVLPRRKDDSEMPFIGNNYSQAVTLGNNMHPSPSSVNISGTEGSPAASSARACVASPPNSSVRGSSFFSTALMSRASPANSHPSTAEVGDEKPSSTEVDTPNESVLHGFFPVSNKGAMEVEMINAKLLPVLVTTGGAEGAPIFTVANLQCFESSSGPVTVDRLPRESTNVPVVFGVTANCDRSKELSSVQRFSSNHSLSALNKSCGWKRPWQALHESTCKPLHLNRLDLNALAGEIDATDKDRDSAALPQGQQSAVGAHHSEGLIRTASGDCSLRPLKIRLCGAWEETRSSETTALRDVGFYSGESILGCRTSESKRKESCSSIFPTSSLAFNRPCASSSEIQLLTGSARQKSTDNFLTLGLSNYSASAQLEDEVNSQEVTTLEGAKRVDLCSKEGHDVFQLRLCNSQQAQKMGSHPVVPGDGEARLSCSFSSFSPAGSLTEHCRRQTERKMEESLDLRLKLAL